MIDNIFSSFYFRYLCLYVLAVGIVHSLLSANRPTGWKPLFCNIFLSLFLQSRNAFRDPSFWTPKDVKANETPVKLRKPETPQSSTVDTEWKIYLLDESWCINIHGVLTQPLLLTFHIWASHFKSSTLTGRHNMPGVHRLWLEFGGSMRPWAGSWRWIALVLLAWGTLLFYIGGHLVRDNEHAPRSSRELAKILTKLERLKQQNEDLRRMAQSLR